MKSSLPLTLSWRCHPFPWHYHEGVTPSLDTIMRASPLPLTPSWGCHPFAWHLHHEGATPTLKPSWWSHPFPWHLHHVGVTPSTDTFIMRVLPLPWNLHDGVIPSLDTITRGAPLSLTPSCGCFPFHWHFPMGGAPSLDTFIMRLLPLPLTPSSRGCRPFHWHHHEGVTLPQTPSHGWCSFPWHLHREVSHLPSTPSSWGWCPFLWHLCHGGVKPPGALFLFAIVFPSSKSAPHPHQPTLTTENTLVLYSCLPPYLSCLCPTHHQRLQHYCPTQRKGLATWVCWWSVYNLQAGTEVSLLWRERDQNQSLWKFNHWSSLSKSLTIKQVFLAFWCSEVWMGVWSEIVKVVPVCDSKRPQTLCLQTGWILLRRSETLPTQSLQKKTKMLDHEHSSKHWTGKQLSSTKNR